MNSSRQLPPISQELSRAGPVLKVLRRRLGGFDWMISEPFQGAHWLESLEYPRCLLEPPAEPLKPAVVPGREVVRVRGADATAGDLVVKRFIPRGLAETLKWSWRTSPAYRAFELARHLEALGLRTATPVAAGERRAGGLLRESFLLTCHVPDATPLYLFNAGCADRRRRGLIVRDLARIYAAMHDAGFYHSDPSQTNFLAVPQPDGGDALVLIDLDGVRWRRRMSLAEAAKDLRRLLLRCRVPRHERAWFIAVYSRLRKMRIDAHELVTRVGPLPERATIPHCALDEDGLPTPAVFPPTRPSSSPMGNATATPVTSGQVGVRQCGGLRWQVRESRVTPQVETILRAPDPFLEQAKVLKPNRSSAVGSAGGIVLKRYNYRKWASRFKDLFRNSRGPRCFSRACLLENAGVPTARPIAAAERRYCGLVMQSYFVMEEIPGAVPLSTWRGNEADACQRVADLLARLHREGFIHRDLKGGNILFDASGRPHLIDLDGLRHVRRVSNARAAADLARLARDLDNRHPRLSRFDRARFVIGYCRARGFRDWRWWWREIARRQTST